MHTQSSQAPRPQAKGNTPASTEYFVFCDHQGRRWPRLKKIAFFTTLFLFIGVVLFVQTLVIPSQLTPPSAQEQLQAQFRALDEAPTGVPATKQLWLDFAKPSSKGQDNLQPVPNKISDTEIHLGLYEDWDPNSYHSLAKYGDQLTHLAPDWIRLKNLAATVQLTANKQVLAAVRQHHLGLLPLFRNLGKNDSWEPESIEWIIHSPQDRQQALARQLVVALHSIQAQGVLLDWQQIDPSYRKEMSDFLTLLAKMLHRDQLQLWLSLPIGRELKVFDLEYLAAHIDRFVAQLHDEHGEHDQPGPIASHAFYKGWLTTLVTNYGSPKQWIISQGAYGYDWTGQGCEQISFQDAMSRATHSAQSGTDLSASLPQPHYRYNDGLREHTVWFLDAVNFLNQLELARSYNVGGVAINRLGNEDPGLWQVLALPPETLGQSPDFSALQRLSPNSGIGHIGAGNLLRLLDTAQPGFRPIEFDAAAEPGTRYQARYMDFPKALTLLHQGNGTGEQVSLSFDDGPDEQWTPQILDILKRYQLKATFFMVGANMENHPDIVRRVVEEGHLIGVHTYNHPNVALISTERAHLELNATQRLIQSLTGHRTLLFRPPYNADSNPHTSEHLVPIRLAQSMGYLTISEDIDTQDWDRPGVAAMVARVKEGRQQGGSVVLLHDAGGDRSQSVAALTPIINYLQARGDSIVPLTELLGVPQSELMPKVAVHEQSWTQKISASGFMTIHGITNFFWAFMLVTTLLLLAKTGIISWLALRSRNTSPCAANTELFTPGVSLLLAAYNEEKVIVATLQSLLSTDYGGEIEIIVVDDGSTDTTAALVDTLAQKDPRIRLLHQTNTGKAKALQRGLRKASHGLVVTLDADTQFEPSTIAQLISPLRNPEVAAVSGRARVGNPRTLFARFQALEYSCGFNLERRAYHQLNCITVVPGAISALRLSAVHQVGGISNDTLAEDTDLTLSLHRAGFRICYAPKAIAWTEAPETLTSLSKQRFRWSFGTLQCLWKHRELLFNRSYPALGWFSLPLTWFFSLFLVSVGTLIDLILIACLIIDPTNSALYNYFLLFLLTDGLLAALALWIEDEPFKELWLVLPMRFLYRPVLNFVVLKAIIRACKGAWVGWGKLERTATVQGQPVNG